MRLSLRVPEALLVHLKDEAAAHHRSVNAEILHLLMDPKRRVYSEARQHMSQKMRDLAEDLYGDGGLQRIDAGLPVAGPWPDGWTDDVLKDWAKRG